MREPQAVPRQRGWKHGMLCYRHLYPENLLLGPHPSWLPLLEP